MDQCTPGLREHRLLMSLKAIYETEKAPKLTMRGTAVFAIP